MEVSDGPKYSSHRWSISRAGAHCHVTRCPLQPLIYVSRARRTMRNFTQLGAESRVARSNKSRRGRQTRCQALCSQPGRRKGPKQTSRLVKRIRWPCIATSAQRSIGRLPRQGNMAAYCPAGGQLDNSLLA